LWEKIKNRFELWSVCVSDRVIRLFY